MTTYKQGDVLLVPYPYTDQSATKRRPAVIVSADWYNATRPDVLLAAVTSQFGGSPQEIELLDWQSEGLQLPSVVKPIVTTLDQTRIIRVLGTLSPRDLGKVLTMIHSLFENP